MKLESGGVIIELKPFGERDFIGRVFTSDHGVLCGIFKAGQIAKKNRPLVGQAGHVSHSARLDSQLGALHFESEKNLVAPLFSDPEKLKYAQACFALLSAMLPEREAYQKLYDATVAMLCSFATTPPFGHPSTGGELGSACRKNHPALRAPLQGRGTALCMLETTTPPFGRPSTGGELRSAYIQWELCLLAELGYGLALDRCGNCGAAKDLKYISPRTGRAVCEKCGNPFADKLFRMPPDLRVTAHFLAQVATLPFSRTML